ncbi:hypothetical protein Nmel_012807, partial [Mimus melanotis]
AGSRQVLEGTSTKGSPSPLGNIWHRQHVSSCKQHPCTAADPGKSLARSSVRGEGVMGLNAHSRDQVMMECATFIVTYFDRKRNQTISSQLPTDRTS